jgi:hypothetical protein
MRRWHEERDLMIRRWRIEIAKHEYPRWGDQGLAPVPPAACEEDACHCYRGMGFSRKRKPGDCGNPRCGICHTYKWERHRQNDQVVVLKQEWVATGGW